ncbi:hypothetical protein ACEUZ9_004039 [Paracoccus litorisediminis]|uniref:hypothetical protein n=1 Tax=Paracoccus litorisediminis TaxID=2006130 RepID=UPI00372F0644
MMPISPSGAISRLSKRFGERRKRQMAGDRPPLTSDDEKNISEFEVLITTGIRVLEMENEALVSGDVARVAEYYERKTELLRELTLRQPVIEPFLKDDLPEIANLRDLIRELRDNLQRNGVLLQGMASASRSILSEIERVRKRQSLDGVYDKSGHVRAGLGAPSGKTLKNL